MNALKLYQHFAGTLDAYQRCIENGNEEWTGKHLDTIKVLNDEMPHGSGLDAETDLIIEESTSEKLVFGADYHHMDEAGGYDGWTEHRVIITPSLLFGFNVKVTGRDRNDIKDYIAETFQYALSRSFELVLADEKLTLVEREG